MKNNRTTHTDRAATEERHAGLAKNLPPSPPPPSPPRNLKKTNKRKEAALGYDEKRRGEKKINKPATKLK